MEARRNKEMQKYLKNKIDVKELIKNRQGFQEIEEKIEEADRIEKEMQAEMKIRRKNEMRREYEIRKNDGRASMAIRRIDEKRKEQEGIRRQEEVRKEEEMALRKNIRDVAKILYEECEHNIESFECYVIDLFNEIKINKNKITVIIGQHSARNQCRCFVEKHQKQLVKDYNLLVRENEYGILDYVGWYKKHLVAIESVVWLGHVHTIDRIVDEVKELAKDEIVSFQEVKKYEEMSSLLGMSVVAKIIAFVEEKIQERNVFIDSEQDFAGMTGDGYEKYLGRLISSNLSYWRVEFTKVSGDQGVDLLVMSPSNIYFAIQAKFYSSPVGNKAVQEVIAGKLYYKAEVAIVVTNSTFTKRAEELAEATNVELIHHNMLIDRLVAIERELLR